MKSFRKQLTFSIFLLTLLPSLLAAHNANFTQDDLWSLKPGWWKELTSKSTEVTEQRIKTLVQSLQQIEQQVPPDNQEWVHTAIQRISVNMDQFLALHSSQGWKIEEAPSLKDQYNVEDFLSVVKEVKTTDSQLQDKSEELKQLIVTRDRTYRQIDESDAKYINTPEKSLQRTLAGLNLIVSMTNLAIIEERTRLKEEEISGIKQKLGWVKNVLNTAETRLIARTLDPAAIDAQITESSAKVAELDYELLQLETELLASGQTSNQFDKRSLLVLLKRILLSRAQVQLLAAQSKKGLIAISGKNFTSQKAAVLLEDSKRWEKDLDKLSKRTEEWKISIRREQDSAESLFVNGAENSRDANPSFLAHQRVAQNALVNIRDLSLEVFQTRQLAQLISNDAVQNISWFSGFWKRSYFTLEEAAIDIFEALSYPLFRINERPVSIFSIFYAVFIFLFAYWSSFILRRLFTEFARRKEHISAASIYTFKRVTHYVILLIGLVWALGTLGVDFSNLLIIAGALSLGIGFGLQGIVNNFLGGLIVLFDRKLRVGDFIELSGGQTGHITEVNVQNTVIRTLTGHDILVPNSDIITRQLTNWTLRDQYARFHIPFGVSYGTDKDIVKKAGEKAALEVVETVTGHKTLPDPNVWLVGFGDSSLNFELVVWVDLRRGKKRQSSILAAYYWEIETALKNAGIEIPFPQRDLHLKSGEWISTPS